MAEAAGIIRYAVGVGCGDALPQLPLKELPFQGQKPPALSASTTFKMKTVLAWGP